MNIQSLYVVELNCSKHVSLNQDRSSVYRRMAGSKCQHRHCVFHEKGFRGSFSSETGSRCLQVVNIVGSEAHCQVQKMTSVKGYWFNNVKHAISDRCTCGKVIPRIDHCAFRGAVIRHHLFTILSAAVSCSLPSAKSAAWSNEVFLE